MAALFICFAPQLGLCSQLLARCPLVLTSSPAGGIPFAGPLVSGGPVFVFPTAASLRDILSSQASGFREKGRPIRKRFKAFNNEVPDEALEPIGLTGASSSAALGLAGTVLEY